MTHAIELCKAICGFAPILAASTNSFAFFFALHNPCYVKLHITRVPGRLDRPARRGGLPQVSRVGEQRGHPLRGISDAGDGSGSAGGLTVDHA